MQLQISDLSTLRVAPTIRTCTGVSTDFFISVELCSEESLSRRICKVLDVQSAHLDLTEIAVHPVRSGLAEALRAAGRLRVRPSDAVVAPAEQAARSLRA